MKNKLLNINIVLTIFLASSLVLLLGVFASIFMFQVKALPFWQAQEYTITYDSHAIAYGDFDNDGFDDLAIEIEGSKFAIYLNDGIGLFSDTPTYTINTATSDPLKLVSADFNGDNYDDIAFASNSQYELLLGAGFPEFAAGSLGVYLSDGDGTFSNSVFLPNGYTTFECPLNPAVCQVFNDLVVDDFNNDTYIDIAATDPGQNKVVVFTNDGNGTFTVATNFTTGSYPRALSSGDIDNDGNSDLITANYNDKDVSAFFGAGDGSFSGRIDTAIAVNPFSLVSADFNDDGIIDIASSGYVNKYRDNMVVLLGNDDGSGNGDGTFTQSYYYIYDTSGLSTLWGARYAHVYQKDLNSDNIPDLSLIVRAWGYSPTFTGVVAFLYSNGDGTFTPAGHYDVSNDPTAMTITDFNNDNNLDIAVTAWNQSANDFKFNLLYGIENGGLGGVGTYRLGNDPEYVHSVDLDNDGNNDLVVANYSDVNISVLMGYGNGSFSGRTNYTVGGGPKSISSDDFDEDGNIDLAVATANNAVSILLGNGDGTLDVFSSYGTVVSPRGVVSADFDGDGNIDVATANNHGLGTNALSVLLNNGSGTLDTAVTYNSLQAAKSIVAEDFDDDGDMDLVLVGNWNVLIWENALTGWYVEDYGGAVHYNNGDGSFTEASFFLTSGHLVGSAFGPSPYRKYGPYSQEVRAGDLNEDGITDLSIANKYGDDGYVTVLLGSGSGEFLEPVDYLLSSEASGLALGDLNGDNIPDIAATTVDVVLPDPNDSSVDILINNGNGTFYLADSKAVGVDPISVACADFTNDGLDDLAIVNYVTEDMTVYSNLDFILDSVSPEAVFAGSPTFSLTVVGSGFDTNSVVRYNGSSRSTSFVDSTHLETQILTSDLSTTGINNITVYHGVYGHVTNSVLLRVEPNFLPIVGNNSVSALPKGLANGDFDSDGDIDLVIANDGSDVVSVLLNSGLGSYDPKVNYNVGTGPVSVSVADYNDDNNLDIAVVNSGDNSISILMGNGDGSFIAAVDYSVGTNPQSVFSGDFNDDNIPDLAVANYGNNNISVLLNNGDSTFTAAVNYSIGTNPQFILGNDYNDDDVIDLITANRGGNNISLVLGVGDGSFGSATSFSTGNQPYALTSTDFNGDDNLDIAIANAGSNNITIKQGNGSGSFNTGTTISVGTSPYSIAHGDYNNDEINDLVVANYSDDNISLLLGDGIGGFGTPVVYDAGTGPYAMLATDISGDGISDVITANSGSDDISILYGRGILGVGTNLFSPAVNYNIFKPTMTVSADFDDDGNVDVAVGNFGTITPGYLKIFWGSGSGSWSSIQDIEINGRQDDVLAEDFDNDGDIDLIVSATGSSLYGNNIAVILNNGDGSFADPEYFNIGDNLLLTPLISEDFNNDGNLDIAGGSYDGNLYTVFGNGDGTINVSSLADYAGGRLSTLSLGDYNNDNQPDIALVSFITETIYIYLGNPDGSFSHLIDYSTQASPQVISSADINSDNNQDLLITRSSSHDIGIYLGNGDGTFADPYFYYIEDSRPHDIQALDVNSDNLIDLVATNRIANGTIEVFLGYGNGNFDPNVSYDVDRYPTGFSSADYNNDGKLDIAVANTYSDNISILLGKVSQARAVRFSPLAPDNLICQPVDGQIIHWIFDDNSINELGFRLYDNSKLLKSIAQPDMEYFEETELLPNELYEDRFVLAFNDAGESASTKKVSCYTLSNEPLPLIIESDPLGIKVTIDNSDGNPAYTQYAIYEYLKDKYLQVDGSLSDQEAWHTYAQWGSENGVVSALDDYELYVLASNEDGLVSGYKPSAVDLRCDVQNSNEINWLMRLSPDIVKDGFALYQPREEETDILVYDIADSQINTSEYLETELQPNSQYTRYLQAYSIIEEQYSEVEDSEVISCYTLANEPLPVIIGEITEDSVQIIINEADGNPGETQYSLYEANSGLYVQADGSLSSEPVWQTRTEWGGSLGVYVNVSSISGIGDIEVIAQFLMSLSISDYDFVAQVRNSAGVVTEKEIPVIISANKKVGINVQDELSYSGIAKVANAENGYKKQVSYIRLLQELSVFINIVLGILVILLVISILSTLSHLPAGKGLGEKLRFLLHLFVKQPVDAFADNAKTDSLGTYKQSYENHKKYHEYTKKTLNRTLGVLAIKVFVVMILVLGLSQINHQGIAQEDIYEKDGQDIKVGDEVTYKIEYSNLGEGVAENVVISDSLDVNLSYVDDSVLINKGGIETTEGISFDRNLISFNLGTVSAGETGYVELTGLVNEVAEKLTIKNTARLSGDNFLEIITNETSNYVQEQTEVVVIEDLTDKEADEKDSTTEPVRVINNPPQAIDDSVETNLEQSVVIFVLENDTDQEENLDISSLAIVTEPANGLVLITLENSSITYTPDEEYIGTDSFSYKICDLENACDQAIVAVTVNPEVVTGLIKDEGEEVGISIIGSLLKAVSSEISDTSPAQSVIQSIVESNKTVKAIVESAPVKAVREQVLNNPTVEIVSQDVVTPALVTVAVVNTVPTVAAVTVNLWSYLHFLFIEPLLLLFRKKRKKWGIVYDSLSKTPISLAVVRLYSKKDKKLLQTKVTDKDGRYLIIVKEPGKYYLEIIKPGFDYPSKILKDEKQDTKYVDLYHGESIEVKEKGGVITANIPLDTKAEKVKPIKEVIKSYTIKNLRLLTSYVGLILAVIVLVIYPSIITLFALILHMAFYGTFRKILVPKKLKSWGIIYDKKSKEPLNYAVVRIFDMKFNKLLETQVTDAKGRYAFLASKNIYQLSAEKQGYQMEEIKDIDMIKKEDVVNLDIGLKKNKKS